MTARKEADRGVGFHAHAALVAFREVVRAAALRVALDLDLPGRGGRLGREGEVATTTQCGRLVLCERLVAISGGFSPPSRGPPKPRADLVGVA